MSDIKLIEVNSELGAGTRGASLGAPAMKIAALNSNSTFFKKYPSTIVETENELLLDDVNTPFAKRIEGVSRVYGRVCSEVSKVMMSGRFPVVLSGDHSSAGGTIAGIKKANPDKRLGVIWIDAHADLHTPYTTPSGNIHGMPLATAIAADNTDKKVNDIGERTQKLWDDLKNTGGISPKVKPHDIVFIAVRSTEAGEDYLIDKYSICNFKVEEVKGKGADAVALEAMKSLKDCDLIYISFDVDSMDPSISRGTGTPVENGISEAEARQMIMRLLSQPKVCGFEIVEVNPTLDNKCNKMAEVAFSILEEAVGVIESR